ncbi:glycoside hydrolase family 76 protein [Proteiniphilum saccharofermentans]|uniref:glycoside hydrolase family 76 protein n=1 Tax=Proteiniphilum saccharofermentans TaxID=1642647 RepID=UPI0028AB958D|nr:glycoside hydrolase family 76 protein [Proteiniphilum saccharofermentans]
MKKKYLFLIMLVIPLWWSCGKEDIPANGEEEEEETIDWNAAANASSMTLVNQFWNSGGNYFNTDNSGNTTFQYWPNAHALDVLIDAYERTGNTEYSTYFDRWFQGVKAQNGNTWNNDFYDDMEWNALAMLRAYKVTNDTKYKDAVLELWGYIKEGWNDNAGGGITWKKGMEYSKNACSNGPAAILAARLYQEFGNEEDREWAIRIYGWLKSTLVNPNTGAVWDNINSNTGEINKEWIFTYNQGTYIGSAVELYKIFNEKAYLNDAVKAADYTIGSLVENSVLKSEGTGDGGLFKGIFIRYFTDLIQQERLDAPIQRRYLQFMKLNAETLWEQGTTQPAVLFGPNWRQKPGTSTGLTEQLSGCMLIEAAALLEKEELLN